MVSTVICVVMTALFAVRYALAPYPAEAPFTEGEGGMPLAATRIILYRLCIMDSRKARLASAFFLASRLSNSCLPLQRPINTFAMPFLKYIRNGSMLHFQRHSLLQNPLSWFKPIWGTGIHRLY